MTMTYQINQWSDVSAIANAMQDDAIFIIRQTALMPSLVTVLTDATGMNPRKGYKYGSGTISQVSDGDDLASQAFTPALDQTLTPYEYGMQYFVTDARAESELPESIMTDATRDLSFAAVDKIETLLCGDMASLTGGTVGTAGTAITWGYVSAAIARARNANKSNSVPLSVVIHVYQAAVLAKSASIAGATTVAATGVADQVTRQGITQAFTFMGVPVYQVFASPDANDDFTGGVFPREALALDWRRPVRIVPQRDESRRGTEFNMSLVIAHGVWRPDRGVKMVFDATAPTS